MNSALKILANSVRDPDRFIDILQPSMNTQSHRDLFLWLQGDLQEFLPHDIFLAAWADEKLENMQIDLVSSLPGLRTKLVLDRGISPFVKELFVHWKQEHHHPFSIIRADGFSLDVGGECSPIDHAFEGMKSALAHGIKDLRKRYQCLYVAFSRHPRPPPLAASYLSILIPHIDVALRQLAPLEYQDALLPAKAVVLAQKAFGLTQRESEVMSWVSAGKTNEVIGVILNISSFTVKNHLKRVFQKLEVTNRAQAVSKIQRPFPALST